MTLEGWDCYGKVKLHLHRERKMLLQGLSSDGILIFFTPVTEIFSPWNQTSIPATEIFRK